MVLLPRPLPPPPLPPPCDSGNGHVICGHQGGGEGGGENQDPSG